MCQIDEISFMFRVYFCGGQRCSALPLLRLSFLVTDRWQQKNMSGIPVNFVRVQKKSSPGWLAGSGIVMSDK